MKCKSRNLFAQFLKKFKNRKKEDKDKDKDQNFKVLIHNWKKRSNS